MRSAVFVAAALSALVAVDACSSKSRTGSSKTSATIGPEGGILSLPNGVVLNVPPGALSAPTMISATAGDVPSTLATNTAHLSLSIRFEPDGLAFTIPAELVVPYSALSNIPAGGVEKLFFFSTSGEDSTPEIPSDEDVDAQEESRRITRCRRRSPQRGTGAPCTWR